LLYVGCSGDAERRVKQHDYAKWYRQVIHTRVRVYPSREQALAVEKRAIQLLRPKYNKVHNPDWTHPLAMHKVDRRAPKFKTVQSYRNWKAAGFTGFDAEAANALKKGDL
jgi:excinuclease UvrABC nuclease subunit